MTAVHSGVREAHCHIGLLGEAMALPDLGACSSLKECLDRVREAAAETSPGSWLRFKSARPAAWPEQRWPTIQELDRAAPHRPCVIMSFDHHMACANSAALRGAGLRPGEQVGPKGHVAADAQGAATGILHEHASYRCWESAPPPDPSARRDQVRSACKLLADLGFTEAHDLHTPEWLIEHLLALEESDELPFRRVDLYPNVAVLQRIYERFAPIARGRVRIVGGKLFSDGTLNARTALTLHPYRTPQEGSPKGVAMATPNECEQAVRLTESLGLHLAVHAIGDGAVRMVLDAIEHAGSGPRDHGRRHRIEHCELIDALDVPRFARMGVICSVQPCHLLTDIEVLRDQLPHRLDRVLPLRELIDSGCTPGELLVFGSDVPIVRANPEDSVHAAVHRRREGMAESEAVGWSQRISEAECWKAFGKA